MPRRRCRAGKKIAWGGFEMEAQASGLAEWVSFIYTFPLFIEIS
jgi:hypothetical protein